jgi:DnaK suppressor protein
MKKESNAGLDADFVESQRQKLLKMRAQLISDGDAAAMNEGTVQDAAGDEPGDAVDDASRLEQLETDEALLAQSERRVIEIDRALQKIVEGTYGLSDGNGMPIERAHLDLVPEAILTRAELQRIRT